MGTRRASRLRAIPSVDALLARPALEALARSFGREIVKLAARSVLAGERAALARGGKSRSASQNLEPLDAMEALEARILAEVESLLAPSLRPVINATGVVLHTNLGRAPLATAAMAQIENASAHYSNLEYDIESGARGRRDVHVARLLASLAGAEAAIVVNNNAAAVFLVLNTLAKGAEVIVSRGELVEIGDGFRIPDIMAESGAVLREVGTTNRTRIHDYERAISSRTRLLLRVHPSNFRITGFTERPSLDDVVALGRRTRVPVFEDLGSGCLADLTTSGVAEPLVRASCAAGASAVSFSGDKLLGGPQGGIIAGKTKIIERIRRNPLFRALRVDKLTLAALEWTLKAYLRGALDEIPALGMIRLTGEAIARRAADFVERVRPFLPGDAEISMRAGSSVTGGGSTPGQQLPTRLIVVASRAYSASALAKRLRQPVGGWPVVARIEDGRVTLDLRTVFPTEEPALASALASALKV